MTFIVKLVCLVALGFLIWYYFKSKSTESINVPDIQEKQADIQEKQAEISEKRSQIDQSIQSTFIPSPTFNGYKRGYVFKLGEKGQGYYKEKKVSFSDRDRITHYNPNESPQNTKLRF